MSSAHYGHSSDDKLISNEPHNEVEPLQGENETDNVYCNPTTSNPGRCIELAVPSRNPPNDMRFSTLSNCSSYHGLAETPNENQSRHFFQNPYLLANLRVVIGSTVLTIVGAVLIGFSLFVTLVPNEMDVHGWIFALIGVLFFIPGFYHIFLFFYHICGRSGYPFENLPTFSLPS